jgi:hypothetical protein
MPLGTDVAGSRTAPGPSCGSARVAAVARRVFLHVGLPKSGTTYVQAVLAKNKAELQRSGVLYPGERWAFQVNAVKDLRNLGHEDAAGIEGAWDALVKEVASWDGDVVVSMEWLCASTPEEIERLVRDLGRDSLHVVFTVRDIARTVPAAWQEFMQNRQVWTWADFLASLTGESDHPRPRRRFAAQQDLQEILPRWLDGVRADQVHVVTLPQRGAHPAELWKRMVRVLGLPEDGHYVLDDLGANQSLGMESAELMRRLNVRARRAGIGLAAYNRVFKRQLGKQLLAARKGRESKVALPVRYHDWARAEAERQIAAIQAAGVQVVGDLDELRPVLPEGPRGRRAAKQPVPPVDRDGVLEAAIDALFEVATGEKAPEKDPPREGNR